MSAETFEVVSTQLRDTADAPKGSDIYYQCARCGAIIPSRPRDSIGCECDNLFIDVDYHRLSVRRMDDFVVLRRTAK